jgi:cyclic pyranopterin phosphate synthase
MTASHIFDNHGRPITYVRLAVTDRCNLRCFYCMPADGIAYLPKQELLTYEELERLVTILANLGVSKVRLTGGEPFVRTDLMKLIRAIVRVDGIQQLHLTTNGILTAPHIPELKELGVSSINLSLDTLDRQRFHQITRRDEFDRTFKTLNMLFASGIPVKINAVVMDGKNIDDIIPLVSLTRDQEVSVRFIEEMPFNGEGSHYPQLLWTHHRILEHIQKTFPNLQKIEDEPHSTSLSYRVPGYRGTIGIIAAFSRTFCGTCNRIRVTAQGTLKTCLYDDGVLNLKTLMRNGTSDEGIADALKVAFAHRPKNGFEAERNRSHHRVSESMSTIGG